MLTFNKKRILKLVSLVFLFFVLTTGTTFAQTTPGNSGQEIDPNNPTNVLKPATKTADTETKYNLLAPFGEKLTEFDANKQCAFTEYINIMFDILIGICAVLAFLMLVIGGIQYMTSDLISSKEEAKSQATNAILGLLLAVSAWLILNTINPKLLDFCLDKNLQVAEFTLEEQIKGRLGQGICQTITDEKNACHPKKLTSFSNPEQASAICNGESRGNPNAKSGVDVGIDGTSFSIGLFQINIIAHGDNIGDGQICKGIFSIEKDPVGKVRTSRNDETLGGCLKLQNGVCIKYAARVISKERYNKCVAFISNVNENIKYASALQKRSGWNQWGFNSSCKF